MKLIAPLFAAMALVGGARCGPPASDIGPVSICELASPRETTSLNEMAVVSWDPTATNLGDYWASKVAIQPARTVFGDVASEVFVINGVDVEGRSQYGDFGPTADGARHGFVFTVVRDGRQLVMPGGLFFRDGDVLRNDNIYHSGISEAAFLEKVELARSGGDCRD